MRALQPVRVDCADFWLQDVPHFFKQIFVPACQLSMSDAALQLGTKIVHALRRNLPWFGQKTFDAFDAQLQGPVCARD